jgi:tetratricopeptide (TPR) repeat protein
MDWLASYIDPLNDYQREILKQCLLEAGSDVLLARDARIAARRQADTGVVRRIRDEVTERLCGMFVNTAQVEAGARSVQSFSLGAEALYLAARARDVDSLDAVPIALSDHLSALGFACMERSQWESASTAFDRALEIDPDDATARHYLAFCLDSDALEPKRVEDAYRRSIRIDPSHATWHSRLISFLVVQARTFDAHEQWASSRAHLSDDDGGSPLELYARLHLPVAANLLRRAELPLSYEVLDDVPGWAQKQLSGYRAQRQRLEVLDRAQDWGTVVPAQRASSEWWRDGPQLLGERDADGRPLQLWLAAGVERLSERGLELDVAVIRGRNAPERATIVLSWDDFRRYSSDTSRAEMLEAGDFLEVGYFGLGTELNTVPTIRVLPRGAWTEGIETPLDPARYLKRSSWVTY